MAATKTSDVDPEWSGHFETLVHLFRSEEHPGASFEAASKLLRAVHENTTGWNPDTKTYFLQSCLPELAKSALHRSSYTAEELPRVVDFLHSVLLVIVACMPDDNFHLLEVLAWIFDWSGQHFYRTCGIRQRPLPVPRKDHHHHDAADSSSSSSSSIDNNSDDDGDKKKKKSSEAATADYRFVRGELWSVSVHALDNVEFFGRHGGFDAVCNRIVSAEPAPTTLALRFLLRPLSLIREIAAVGFFAELAGRITQRITTYLKDMPNEALKKLDKQEVDLVVTELEILQRQHGDATDVAKFFDEFRLDYALKCFVSPILEKRLLGLADIKKACESVLEKEFHLAQQQPQHRPPAGRLCWLTADHLCDWIKRHEILTWLYGRSIHIELVRRSLDVLKFLASHNQLTSDELQIVWDSANNQHESLVRVVRQSIADLCPSLSLVQLDHVSLLSRTIPFSLYNHQIIALLRSCTIQAVLKSAGLPLEQRKFYGLPIMWEMLQDQSNANSDNLFQALHFMFDFLSWTECQSERVKYLKMCVDNLRQHTSQAQSLKVLIKVIESFPRVAPDRERPIDTQESVIELLNREDGMLEAFIADLPVWKATSRAAALKQFPDFDAANPPLAAAAATLTGRYTHQENIRDRLQFLNFVLSHSSLVLTSEQLQAFWECFIINSLSATEQDEAFLWLEHAKLPTKTYASFSDEAAQNLFLHNVPALDFAALRTRGFNFLKFYFVWTNVQRQRIDRLIDASGNFAVLSFDLVGIDYLWEVAFSARDQAVGIAASNFLLELHRRLAPELQGQIYQHREQYLVTCIDQVRHARSASEPIALKQQLRIKRALSMIKGLIDQFEPTAASGRNAHQLTSSLAPATNLLLSVKYVQTQQTFQESFPSTATVQDLIERACRQWDVAELQPDNPSVRLVYASRELTDRMATLGDLAIRNKSLVSITTKSEPARSAAGPVDDTGYAVMQCSSAYFGELFGLLTVDPKVAGDIWALLMKLPTNPAIYAQLKAGGDWPSLLTLESPYALLYGLQVVSKLSTPTTYDTPDAVDEKSRWRRDFAASGGVWHLLHLLCQINPDFSVDSKYNETVALLLKLVNSFLGIATVADDDSDSRALPTLQADQAAEGRAHLHLVPKKLSVLLQLRARASAAFVVPPRPAAPGAVRSAPPPTPPSKSQQTACNIIFQEGISLFVATLVSDPALLHDFVLDQELDGWLKDTLLECQSAVARAHIKRGLSLLSRHGLGRSAGIPVHQILFEKLVSFMQLIRCSHDIPTSQHYFELLEEVLNQAAEASASLPNLDALLADLIEMIAQHPTIEKHHDQSSCDQVFIGLSSLTACLLRMGVASPAVTSRLLPHLFTDCLFSIQTKDNHGPLSPPKAKSAAARHAAFQCLLQIGRMDGGSASTLFDLIEAQMHGVLKRDRRRTIFTYDPSDFDRADCGFVGLVNQGATCYMNSLMQQFFMIPQLRYSILQIADSEENKAESLLWQFQTLLSNLLASERKFYDTRPFFGAYKDNGEPVNTGMQMDADEFFNMFLDKLEWATKGSSDPNCLQDIFGGKLIHQIISQECAHTSIREENFVTLSVEVKNKKNITESLELFIKPDILDGDNKYHCAECNAQVAAQKRVCVGTLPNCLIVHLKRFEFDFETFQRRKLNDICEFGNTLNMTPYTLAGLEKGDAKSSEAAASSGANPSMTASSEDVSGAALDEYELSGIVVHTGTTEVGHYYSYIRNREAAGENQWLCFNDTSVETFNPANIASLTFGGTELHTFYDKHSGKEISRQLPKSYSAYILFYERKQPNDNWTKRPSRLPAHEAEALIPRPIYDQIWTDNTIFLEDKQLFDHKGYIDFVVNLCKSAPSPVSTQVLRNGTYFLCEVMLYSKHKDRVHELCEFLAAHYVQNLEACAWLFETLLSPTNYWLQQFCLACPQSETREEFTGLVIQVMYALRNAELDVIVQDVAREQQQQQVADQVAKQKENDDENSGSDDQAAGKKDKAKGQQDAVESDKAASDWLSPFNDVQYPASSSLVLRFVDKLLSMLRVAQFSWRNFDHYFQLMVEFARMGDVERRWLNNRNVIACLIDFYLGTESPYVSLRRDPRSYDLGDKNSAPAVDQLIELVSVLARRHWTEAAAGCGRPTPYQIESESGYALSAYDIEMLQQTRFYTKALRQNVKNFEGIIDTALHFCWANAEFSKSLINDVLHAFYSATHSKYHPFFVFFVAFFSIHDDLSEWRIDYGLSNLIRVIDANLKFPISSQLAIRFLADLCAGNKQAADWMFAHRDAYTESWLIVSQFYDVREAAELLVQALAPSVVSPTALRSAEAPEPEAPSEEDLERLVYIRSLLLQLMGPAAQYTTGIPPENCIPEYGYPPSFFHLSSYFRLLRWCMRTADDVELFCEYWDKFVDLFVMVDTHRYEGDENKKEMIVFWVHVLNIAPARIVELSVETADAKEQILIAHVSLPGQGPHAERLNNFNFATLPYYYHLLYRLAAGSDSFLATCNNHPNVEWAFTSFYLSSDYPTVATALFDLLALIADKYPDYRAKAIPRALSRGIAHTNIILLLEALVQSPADLDTFRRAEGMTHLSQFVIQQQQYLESVAAIPALVRGSSQAIDRALVLLLRSAQEPPLDSDSLEHYWDHGIRVNLLFALLPLLDQDDLLARSDSLWQTIVLLCRVDPMLSLGQAVQCMVKNYQDGKPLPYGDWALQLCRLAVQEDVDEAATLLAAVARAHAVDAAELLYASLSRPEFLAQHGACFGPLFLFVVGQLELFDVDPLLESCRLLLPLQVPEQTNAIGEVLSAHVRALAAKLAGAQQHLPNARNVILHQVGLDLIRLVKFVNMLVASAETGLAALPIVGLLPDLVGQLQDADVANFYDSFEHCMSFRQGVAVLSQLPSTLAANLAQDD